MFQVSDLFGIAVDTFPYMMWAASTCVRISSELRVLPVSELSLRLVQSLEFFLCQNYHGIIL